MSFYLPYFLRIYFLKVVLLNWIVIFLKYKKSKYNLNTIFEYCIMNFKSVWLDKVSISIDSNRVSQDSCGRYKKWRPFSGAEACKAFVFFYLILISFIWILNDSLQLAIAAVPLESHLNPLAQHLNPFGLTRVPLPFALPMPLLLWWWTAPQISVALAS